MTEQTKLIEELKQACTDYWNAPEESSPGRIVLLVQELLTEQEKKKKNSSATGESETIAWQGRLAELRRLDLPAVYGNDAYSERELEFRLGFQAGRANRESPSWAPDVIVLIRKLRDAFHECAGTAVQYEGPGCVMFEAVIQAIQYLESLNRESPAQVLPDESELREIIQSLLNKVNVVTAAYRHTQEAPDPDHLDDLVERQIEVEERLRGLTLTTEPESMNPAETEEIFEDVDNPDYWETQKETGVPKTLKDCRARLLRRTEHAVGLQTRITELEAMLNQGEANSAENAKRYQEIEKALEDKREETKELWNERRILLAGNDKRDKRIQELEAENATLKMQLEAALESAKEIPRLVFLVRAMGDELDRLSDDLGDSKRRMAMMDFPTGQGQQ